MLQSGHQWPFLFMFGAGVSTLQEERITLASNEFVLGMLPTYYLFWQYSMGK